MWFTCLCSAYPFSSMPLALRMIPCICIPDCSWWCHVLRLRTCLGKGSSGILSSGPDAPLTKPDEVIKDVEAALILACILAKHGPQTVDGLCARLSSRCGSGWQLDEHLFGEEWLDPFAILFFLLMYHLGVHNSLDWLPICPGRISVEDDVGLLEIAICDRGPVT